MKSKWNNRDANLFINKYKKKGIDKELALRIYTTQLLGNDPTVVLHGGGNTSDKSKVKTLFGDTKDVIYVKGSGKDMSNIDIDGFPALELDNLINLRKMNKINEARKDKENQSQFFVGLIGESKNFQDEII